MPIYAYKCSACGHAADEMQKVSDAPLTVCPSCGQAAYAKQLSAAGFALKGTGWYATDFKGGGKPAETKAEPPSPACGTGACPACN
ncbi:MAG: zinc ribbon domain-containing protein [Thiobacillus sp.]|nr:zinc ribbon domain-containing protein [Thiobacillus sp.]